jgi:hypothetical protein
MCVTLAPNCHWTRRGMVRFSGACTVFIFIINVHHSRTELPLWIRHGVVRCSGACAVLIFSFPGCPWLPVAVPGCSWAAHGCSRLSLAAPGLLLAAPSCSWLLLAACGCSWLLLAAINVNSKSKENNLCGVLRWDHLMLSLCEGGSLGCMFIMILLCRGGGLGLLKGSTRFSVDNGECLFKFCFAGEVV